MVRARLQNGSFSSSVKILFDTKPLFYTLKRARTPHGPRAARRTREPKPILYSYEIECMVDTAATLITYRPATVQDLPNICSFVDFWLSGGAKRLGIPGAGQDFFVSRGRQSDYLKYKTVYIAMAGNAIIGWAVKSKNKSLIHLLVDGRWRGKAIGTRLLRIIDPQFIRSKSDQSTGNPLDFYVKHGFSITESSTGKHKNIDILQKES